MIDKMQSFGTVIKLDLQHHEDFGYIEVDLGSSEIRRLFELAFEKLPDKTDYQKKCKDSVYGWLFNIKTDFIMRPVLNKKVLKELNAYNI